MTRYDYDRQCWIDVLSDVPDSDGECFARVRACSHPADMQPTCCYAGRHAGEIIVTRVEP